MAESGRVVVYQDRVRGHHSFPPLPGPEIRRYVNDYSANRMEVLRPFSPQP
jgi:hypothetical protein